MTIWVDADACPRIIRDILCRASTRCQVPLVFVANSPIQLPRTRMIRMMQVEKGFDVADDAIANAVQKNDLVITADIPLAHAVIQKGATALNPRGFLYTEDNISERLVVRDMMDELRSTQSISGGPPPLNDKNKQDFSNQLDRWLAKR